jgi:hypothetical protein
MTRSYALLLLFFLAFALPAGSATTIPARGQFDAINLHAQPLLGKFTRVFAKAQLDGERWTRSPAQVALRLSQADFQMDPETLHVFLVSNGGAMVLVDSGNLEDDSLAAVQYRVDFSGLGQSLRIAWAGKRWRCRRPTPHWNQPGSLCP